MGKEVLIQLEALRREKEDLEKRVKKAKNEIERCNRSIVSDVVKGSKGEHYIYGPIKITDHKKEKAIENAQKEENRLTKEWEKAKNAIDEKLEEVEAYIQTVEDSKMRLLLRLRCEDELTFRQISKKMGPRWGEDRCRKTFDKFIKT